GDVAAELLGAIPRAVARDQDGVAVRRWEHVGGVEPHAERRRMWPQQRNRLGEFVTRAAPPKFLIRNVALMTIPISEIARARLGERIELGLREVLRQPVAAVFGEIELL